MKIQQSFGVNQDRFLPVRERGTDSPSFQQLLQENQLGYSKERFQGLLREIDQQGNSLGRSQSIEDLLAFKQTIRNYLKEVVQHGIGLEEHKGFHPNGREKRLIMIKQVDRHLLELSEQVLEKQATSVELLEKIGEIKGLLVNIYL
ncbi:YaaR family protein [Neobacillus sp. 114]|uniref:YaaR family protein n=1 Tax=Neobacillus sp. 114 TaxID=3048535 RepID=UPI0024C3B329|nr:YaaR family protein [Neobacillus sp. 114]